MARHISYSFISKDLLSLQAGFHDHIKPSNKPDAVPSLVLSVTSVNTPSSNAAPRTEKHTSTAIPSSFVVYELLENPKVTTISGRK